MTVLANASSSSSGMRDPAALAREIKRWGVELGFQQVGISAFDLDDDADRLDAWLADGFHGEMGYMARNTGLRRHPEGLVPGSVRAICVRMDYRPVAEYPDHVLNVPALGYVARYALGRDYHKVLRKRLEQLARRIADAIGPHGYRVFTDSAPILEKALARQAGLGWIGKHTNLLDRQAGSWFFLGEILTDLPLPVDQPLDAHCGSCRACIDICPTGAIVGPYRLDARRCISYLTIEHHGPIPESLRPFMGNRIYGCDDCQLVCPWNRYAALSGEEAFAPRHALDAPRLVDLFGWDEATFESRLAGSPVRRIGHIRWLRNLAVAMGNAPPDPAIAAALAARLDHPAELVREHVHWALARQQTTRQGAQ
ncbi:MAG TPA: tRNA epoxyqueuosine(34) reductase QueG [Gammaproteobacteria bacterium]|jgi:epoxyqueuosine reductase|nr:tRNA epoxyqueuosine(34) reductase QueG [Gammaproteobacteria bacterium]